MVAQIDREYVRSGTGRALRRLTSYALFEGRPHATRGQWMNPLILGWLRSLRAFPGQGHLRSPIFITGLGRSGTTILGVLLSLHRSVGFLNEPKAIWSLIDARHDVNGDYVPAGGRFRLGRDDVTAPARRAAHRLFGRYLATVRAERLVDKYPELIFRVDYLLELFPDARIVFITRNGIDASRSIVQWSQRKGTRDGSHTEDWWGRDDVKWRYLWEQVIAVDQDYRDVRRLGPGGPAEFDRAALEWIVTMREGLRQQELHPDAIRRVCYERLVLAPGAELDALLAHCRLPRDDRVQRYAERVVKRRDRGPAPAPALQPAVAALFADTMDRMGYAGSWPAG